MPHSAARRLVAASAAVARERNTVHGLYEVDVTEARRLLRLHRERTGEALSFTAFVVACLGRAVAESPTLNALRRGRKVCVLDDVVIATLIEREAGGETAPELVPIHQADIKSLRAIHEEIRAAQQPRNDRRTRPAGGGRLAGLVPEFLMRAAVRSATRSVSHARESGVVMVSAVGMHGRGRGWGLPLSVWTVAITVGGIGPRVLIRDGIPESREFLGITASFDHDLVDGAPAVRFMSRFAALLRGADLLRGELADGSASTGGDATEEHP
jgi:pyruvate/2-oxoglutarate dehydrogenase complex dihydrolipoamide acyltransferase (E2) component